MGLLCLALVLAAGCWIDYLRQPRYQGVTLNGWLREFDHAWDESIFADFDSIPTQAVVAVRSIGPAAIPELMSRLRREDSMFEHRANQWLEKQSLVEWRFTEFNKANSVALMAFQALGERGVDAVPELTAMLEQPATAGRAVAALGCIGQPAVPVLLRMLAHTNAEIRQSAVHVLSTVTPVTSEALDGVLRLAKDPAPRVRKFVVYYVGGATNHLTRTLPFLVGKLKDSDAGVRGVAIRSFQRAGDRGHEFIPNLMELLCGDPSRSDFTILHQALRELGAPAEMVVPCLIRALDSNDVSVRSQAIYLLSSHGRDAAAGLPRLRQMMEQTADEAERNQLLQAVARIDPQDKVALEWRTNSPSRRNFRRPR